MSEIAFLSDGELSGLFEGLGIDAVRLRDGDDVKVILEDLSRRGYRIIYILEKFASDIIGPIDAMRRELGISIVLIPDHASKLGLGMALARLAAVEAIGADAAFTKKEGS